MGVHLNSTNYNKNTSMPSVHYGRANVAAQYEANARAKADRGIFAAGYAARSPMARDQWALVPPPKEPHKSTIQTVCEAVGSFAKSFCAGFSMTS